MLFPTVEFALLFAVTFPLAWGLVRVPGARLWVLIVASYVFYGYWNPLFCLLLFGSSVVNWIICLAIDRTYGTWRRLWLGIGIAANLAVLGYYKYANFFLASLQDLLIALEMERELPFLEIILPVGISFFTFQGISYIVDVYRREIRASRSLPHVLLYISFFPQLVAGPIVRASTFLPQIEKPPAGPGLPVELCVVLIVSGLFKKLVIANWLGVELVDEVFLAPSLYGPFERLMAVYGFAVQIYCDFSAYSDIAIGVAGLLGYHFPANFDQPYSAASFQEFWRRWHISLSTWLRDYLYIPLGGNRRGRVRTYVNLMLVMVLGGLWHGAAWTFVIWGAIHGTALALERAVLGRRRGDGPGAPAASPSSGWLRRALAIMLVFHVVCLAWVFFRADGLGIVAEFFAAPVDPDAPLQVLKPYHLVLLTLGLALHAVPRGWLVTVVAGLSRLPSLALGAVAGAAILIVSGLSSDGVPPFIYFAF